MEFHRYGILPEFFYFMLPNYHPELALNFVEFHQILKGKVQGILQYSM
jgi:hypothetical protein